MTILRRGNTHYIQVEGQARAGVRNGITVISAKSDRVRGKHEESTLANIYSTKCDGYRKSVPEVPRNGMPALFVACIYGS